MSTSARPINLDNKEQAKSPEEALCTIFDIVQDHLEKMTPKARSK